MAYEQHKYNTQSLEIRMSKSKVLTESGTGDRLFLIDDIFLLCPHVTERSGELSGVSVTRIPFRKNPSYDLINSKGLYLLMLREK